tara:strand:- start:40 stop:420 length:381 start_codon:yes stop_codon:yes gene_type:complete
MSNSDIKYYERSEIPIALTSDNLRYCLVEMNRFNCGFCLVENKSNELIGLFTDGDLRREIVNLNLNFTALMLTSIEKLISENFISIAEKKYSQAKDILIENQINELPLLDENGCLEGMFRILEIRK